MITENFDSRVLDPRIPPDLAQLKMWLALDLPVETNYKGEWYLLTAKGRRTWLNDRLPNLTYAGQTFRLAQLRN